jgi:hypothetical protein
MQVVLTGATADFAALKAAVASAGKYILEPDLAENKVSNNPVA